MVKKRLKGHNVDKWPPFYPVTCKTLDSCKFSTRRYSFRTSLSVTTVLLFAWLNISLAEVLTPPYFNLAQGRRIYASATCGESPDGLPQHEMYCNLVGATTDADDAHNVIGGQYCGECEKGLEGHWHPAEYAIDGSERWWQSPPLSRGVKYNEVNLTIDLGQEFHVAYINLQMANSPRPGVWILERSSDNGVTYHPWQFFAENPIECARFFGRDSILPLTADDGVICDTSNSKVVPLENGEIFIKLLENRPSAKNFFSSEALQQWTRATHVRLRFLRTKTLLGHLMSLSRQDSSVTRRYFYSIKGIEIGGRCRCNGHADICPPANDGDPYKLLCSCQHNTCGSQCEICCPGFVQKAWRVSTNSSPFVCEACNCFGHSNECEYDENVDNQKLSLDIAGNFDGGGVCKNCRHHTEGINCNKCQSGFFRPYGKQPDAIDACQSCNCNYHYSTGNCEDGSGRCECSPAFLAPNCDACSVGYYDYPECKVCDCHHNGTRDSVCEVGGGQCPCLPNYTDKNCDRCGDGYYNFPDCLPCQCEDFGSLSPVCDPENGQCECVNNFGGRNCDQCEDGYYNFPTCTYCKCDVQGTREGRCDKISGECLCREGYGGARCDQCLQGFYGYPECKTCNCSSVGSASTVCDTTGKCPCLPNFSGRTCDQCTPGYYQYPECLPCSCNDEGARGVSCDDEGKCQCKSNFDGLRCEECRGGFYNWPACEECNCDPAGVTESFRGCGDSPPGELCQCKEKVEGRICNQCKPLYWNLQQWNPVGCEDCDCHGPGILGGVRVCEGKDGQCPCKNNVGSRRCEHCLDGFYNMTSRDIFGCQDCGCDVGGSVNSFCDKSTGQCPCRPRITGQQCTAPLVAHFYPTLYQYQYEAEDGTTPSGGQVRFGYDENLFPDFSWRGYAVYSQLQPETNHEIFIDKSSLYFVIIRYHNPSSETIVGEIKAVPDNPSDEMQGYKVRFEPKSGFITVSIGNSPTPFVLNPGRWQFSIKSDQYLLVDYFTILPEPYYEGSVLSHSSNVPCTLNTTARSRTNTNTIIIPDSCAKYKFPSIDKFESVTAAQGYSLTETGDRADLTKFYSDKRVIDALDITEERMALLSSQQPQIHMDLPLSNGGRYALLLEYFTPIGANLTEVQVQTTSNKGSSTGIALIHNCKYGFLCRQVVTTEDGEIAVFRSDKSSMKIALKLGNGEDGKSVDRIAINKVTAIPLGRWSLDHITPREYCVVKNGTCVVSGYELPPGGIRIEAESADKDRVVGEDNLPDGVSGKNLVLLDSQNRTVQMGGRVPISGYYNIIVHYYQPENPKFDAGVIIQDGQHYQAKVPMVHCPSIAGCRAEVAQDDKNTKFYIQDNFLVTLKSPKNVWIDYILLVPEESQSQRENGNQLKKYLSQSPLDDTRKFIAECGKSHFHLAPHNVSQFCKDAVFSITADYNNGALPCQCDYYGSTAFACLEFGGQCPCKDNVIGRQCSRCRTGYFGFPECKPCDCPSTALCDENSGACICPPRVTGEKCDTCSPLTYGFDALIGCEECNCSPLGVENGNQQCDLDNGSCSCKPNVVGRQCDKCKPGFWAFPYCQMCDCDIRGTTEDICSQDTSACNCKVNVEGRSCEQCKPGSFNLQEDNPSGCTSCFCFGKTTRCTTSYMFWTQISFGKSHWTAVALNPHSKDSSNLETDYPTEFEHNDLSGEDENSFAPVYVPDDSVPEQDENHLIYFRTEVDANHLASLGGTLSYTLISEPDNAHPRETFAGPEVILEGNELAPSSGTIRLMHFSIAHLDGDHTMRMNLRLSEDSFVVASHSSSGGLIPATRDQLMVVMKGLKAIYIRGGYWEHSKELRLSNFGIDVATEDYNNQYAQPEDRAVTVEQCHCPPNYQGLSCEECAPGYYRSPSGPFGGFCVPCQCNGHSDLCDPVSGVCLDCKHNTTGDHCDMCEEGFHGDAHGGTPYDCLICACPIPIASNNFATQCELSQDGRAISCTCKDGYIGPRCEGCGPGFFGRPEVPGDLCKPCNCSGNIDPTDPYSCDTVTGACLRCMNNTGGPACALCASGFYGDALLNKNCRQCACNKCGTAECDNQRGECQCLHNLEGFLCDRCKPDHYGLSRCDGLGCQYCDCAIASKSTQCDDLTGQCECRDGTTGQRCERCSPGYWNYTQDGCQACECNSEYAIGVGCDPETGQCSCLPGVVGEKCDRCPWRWVLIEDRGCQNCDSCQHQLLDVTDHLAAELDPVKDEFENVAVSYFTTQKLAYFNDTVTKLKPNVQLMDPSKADLSEYYRAVDDLETDAATQRQKAEVNEDSLVKKAKQSAKLREKSFEVESNVLQAVGKARVTVFEAKDLMEGLLKEDKPSSSPQTDAAKAEAEAIIASMQSVKFDHKPAIEENATVTTVLKDMKKFVRPLDKLNKDLGAVSKNIAEAKDKLRDLRNQSDYSISTSRKANEIGNKIKDAKFSVKLGLLEEKASNMLESAAIATELNLETPKIRQALETSYDELDTTVGNVIGNRGQLDETVNALVAELEQNENTVTKSQSHAAQLAYEADELDAMLAGTKAHADVAVGAATAYKTIADSLNEALKGADMSKGAAENATDVINSLDSAEEFTAEPSRNLLVMAATSQRQVENDLKIPLRDAQSTLANVEGANNITAYTISNFAKELDKLSLPRDTSDITRSVRTSDEALNKAQDVEDEVHAIVEALPDHSNSMKRLRVTVNELNSGTGISDSQLNQAKDSIPLSNAIRGNLENLKPGFEDKKSDVGAKISDLKAQIAAAREQANRVPVGMNLQDSSTLLLANPQSLESQQAQTKVSFYFKTQDDGLIFYIGNEPGKKEEDFMSVEVDRGYAVLTLDLGSGPQRITNEKYVADNQWYKATVDRSGKTVRFTIAQDHNGRLEETVKEDYLTGSKSLFNVDSNSSKLFIGGLPPGVVRSPVRYSTYRGAIEELMIGDEKVGLWNFKNAQNVAPAMERDRFIDLHTETGLRFQGNGYAILDRKQFPLRERSAITFRFKTRSKNGLIFLVGKGRKYMAIYMANGNVVFQYDLGGGAASSRTGQVYNDGQWHTVESVRYRQRSHLTVDGERIGGESPGLQTTLGVGDYMYWGGYPGEHGYPDVSNRAFEGCLEQVAIDQAPVDLTQAVESRYTVVGCPSSQFAPTVATFFGQGYVQVSSADSPVSGPVVVTKDDAFEVNFRMRSNDTNGLVFYGTDADQSNYLSVSLSDGSLVVKTDPGGSEITTDALNDAEWHVVTVTRDNGKLVVNVDDDHEYVESAPGGPIQLGTPGSILLFGGRPDDYDIRSGAAESDRPYSGCLADISINGKRLDFTESDVKEASIGQKCFTEQEKAAMALEMSAPEAAGRTISSQDEDEEDDDSIFGSRPSATPSPTRVPEHHHHHPAPEEPNYDAVDKLTGGEVGKGDDDFDFPESEEEDEKPKKKLDDEVKPTPWMKCALPFREVPKADMTEDVDMDDGVMFGSMDKTSRLEYFQPKEDGSRSEYQIQFKTSYGSGLIFMWTVVEKPDYIALFLRKGFLHFAFDSGAGPAFLNSTVMYNDTQWHNVSVSRFEKQGTLEVDGAVIATGMSAGSTTAVNGGTTIFVGGLPQDAWTRILTSRKLLNVNTPFRGCLRKFKVRSKAPPAPRVAHSVHACRDQVEQGMFFYPNAGYLKLADEFKVGRHIKLSMNIKPRHPSGILVAVHGEKDFMVLQLVNGTVKFSVDSGKGVQSSSFQKETYDLCDGNWHTIRVTKSKNVVTLALDKFHSNPGIGPAGRLITDTNGPLYVGGHPDPTSFKGIETTDQFVGCMKDFMIEGRQYKLDYESIVGTVGLHGCPSD